MNDNLESEILERSSTVTNIAYLMNPTIGKKQCNEWYDEIYDDNGADKIRCDVKSEV